MRERHARPRSGWPAAPGSAVLADGLFLETQIRHGGWGEYDQGITAVVETDDRHTVILTSRRMVAGEIVLVDTPGVTSDNPGHFDYRHRRRSLYRSRTREQT